MSTLLVLVALIGIFTLIHGQNVCVKYQVILHVKDVMWLMLALHLLVQIDNKLWQFLRESTWPGEA